MEIQWDSIIFFFFLPYAKNSPTHILTLYNKSASEVQHVLFTMQKADKNADIFKWLPFNVF